jgi:hypothetical protein
MPYATPSDTSYGIMAVALAMIATVVHVPILLCSMADVSFLGENGGETLYRTSRRHRKKIIVRDF